MEKYWKPLGVVPDILNPATKPSDTKICEWPSQQSTKNDNQNRNKQVLTVIQSLHDTTRVASDSDPFTFGTIRKESNPRNIHVLIGRFQCPGNDEFSINARIVVIIFIGVKHIGWIAKRPQSRGIVRGGKVPVRQQPALLKP